MELYLIEYNNMVIGAYDDFNMAELFINSCMQSKLMINSCKIIKYTKNSCFSTGSQLYNNLQTGVQTVVNVNAIVQNVDTKPKQKIIPSDVSTIPIDLENNETYQKVSKAKSELLHNMNIIKAKKEKLIESKQVYENDLKLFELFSMNKKSDPNFIIPELFVDKFTLFNRLKESGTLTWETFTTEYKAASNPSNDYDEYFVPNNYENEVKAYDGTACGTTCSNSSINEELDIETDSDTDSSDK